MSRKNREGKAAGRGLDARPDEVSSSADAASSSADGGVMGLVARSGAGAGGLRAAQDLLTASDAARQAQSDLMHAVFAAREQGLNWGIVGLLTGLSPDGARTRWGRRGRPGR